MAKTLPGTVPAFYPDPLLWVDANEALDRDATLALLPELEAAGVAVLEQPVPKEDLDGLVDIAQATDILLLADEPIQGPSDVDALDGAPGNLGVNLKVQKLGGLHPTRDTLARAEAQGRPVAIGCNIETGLGIGAGAAFTGAARHMDLDGNLFLTHDPFPLPRPRPGHVGTLEGPGLGVHPDPRYTPGSARTPRPR